MEELELIQRVNGENGAAVDSEIQSHSEQERQSQGLASDDVTRTKLQSTKRNPPARNTSRFWFERFLAVIQRQNPNVIDSSFLAQVAPNNEGKLLAQLKFLHLIDEQGRPTGLLPSLNMVGSEQKKGFQQVIRESYGDLTSEIVVEKAVPDDVVNFFIRRYSFTRDKAINAAKFFLYLAEKGSLSVSQELSAMLNEKGSNGSTQAQINSSSLARPILEKGTRVSKESKGSLANGQRKFRSEFSEAPSMQTVINIRLDKDTPKEYWDRVLALIGERKQENGFLATSAEEEQDEMDVGAREKGNANRQAGAS